MKLSNGTFLHGAKYTILSNISQGNFGITYLAEQISLKRKVCIKEFFFRGSCERSVNGQVTVTVSGQDVTSSFRRKFKREAIRLSQFDNPNIVKVIDVFEDNGTAYMVMEYVDGETLQQLVDRKGKLSEKEALGYIIQLCDALEVVHEKGLLHLDIKPSNILIKRQTNIPVLIDFGISKFTEASGENHSTTTPVALTKGYAPLEQYGQDLAKLTASTDVYSVAATLYKLVTGITPPEAAVIVQDGLKPPKEINPLLSEQLNSIIIQSLSVKPSLRALSISKLKADLRGISKQEISETTEVLIALKKSKSNTSITDIDGNEYNILKIGNQVWMAENLKVTHYRNNNPIINVNENNDWQNLSIGACCDYENNPVNGSKYGKLYNWHAVSDQRNIAPVGWHVATDAEWNTLISFLGGEDIAGCKLKESGTKHWSDRNIGATNEFGFTALPGGKRGSNGAFYYKCQYGYWWSSSEGNPYSALSLYIYNNISNIFKYQDLKNLGFSVRCVKD